MSAQDLERIRSELAHNGLQNGFANVLGLGTRPDLPIAERSTQILAAWEMLRGEAPAMIEADAVRDCIARALKNWRPLRQALEDFFDEAPRRCGMKPTRRCLDARRQVLDGSASWAEQISRFVDDFEILAQAPENDRRRRLEELWSSIDGIQGMLRTMRAGFAEDALFGEYFERLED